MNKLNVPDNVAYILNKLNSNGFSAYMIGGCVRDSLLGIEPKDWDITTNATPDEIESLFEYTIPTGKQYGTITVVINKEPYEVTTFRADSNYSDGRRPDKVVFSNSLKEDVIRRDFTINSLAYNEEEGLVDYVDGISDLTNGIVRAVGEPDKRFKEDSLRILRALRFAFKYDFDIEENTFNSLIRNMKLIKNVSNERITSELVQIIKYIKPSQLLVKYLPLIQYLLDTNIEYNCDLINCLFNVKDFEVRLAYLLSEKSITECQNWLKKMKFSNNQIKSILGILDIYHNRYNYDKYYVIRKSINKWGFTIVKMSLSLICLKDNRYEGIYNNIIKNHDPLFIKDLVIDGNYLKKKYNLDGVTIGNILNECMENVLINPENNTKDKLDNIIEFFLYDNIEV